MPAKVILNPYSARWEAQARWPEAGEALKSAGVEFELDISDGPGNITGLAEKAARDGFSPIIAAGGDGTIGETVNGLARAAKSVSERIGPFGVIPLGTANDLVDNIGLPRDLNEAARVIAAGKIRRMDLISANGQVFANNSALGLEPMITIIQADMVWAKGILRYLLAALTGIMRNPRWEADLTWPEGEYHGPLSLVTVGNGARTGGLFFMTPHADPFDGKLTFVYGFRSGRLAMLRTLPRAMKPGEGSYVEMEGINEINADWVRIHLHSPSPAHTDGEIFTHAIQDVEYRIQPGRLRLLMPE
jgi:diacylglycerol kinase (ATP)